MNVSVSQALKLCKDNNHIILDVRTASECAQGFAKGAVCLELTDIEEQATTKLSKLNSYYVMCQAGPRSVMAIEKLKQLGFKKIFQIELGYQAWKHEKLPIEIPEIDNNDLRYQRHHQLAQFQLDTPLRLDVV